ncbi:MAG: hypothetical protein KDD52_10200, partial [Bdellovibrionales bacterium]|nr:hypothetical protein [Bdellovibrionales bacterium]
KSMKVLFCSLFTVFSASSFAKSLDYSISVYGSDAQKIFNASPKRLSSSSCSYAEASPDKQGDLGETLNKLINNKDINSVMCVKVGKKTFACEGSTLWFYKPCQLE